MAQYSLIVSSAADLDEVTSSSTALDFVTEESAPALYYLANAGNWLRWETPGNTAVDFDFYVRWKIAVAGSVGRYHGPCVRWTGATDGNSYLLASGGADGRRSLYKIPADVELDAITITDPTTYHWTRLKIEGSQLYGKAWHGDVTDEPSEWDLTATDSAYTVAGYCGLHGEQMTAVSPAHVTHLYLGTDGDLAPIGDDEETPAPWHHSMFAAVALAGVGTSPPVTQAMSPLALLNF